MYNNILSSFITYTGAIFFDLFSQIFIIFGHDYRLVILRNKDQKFVSVIVHIANELFIWEFNQNFIALIIVGSFNNGDFDP